MVLNVWHHENLVGKLSINDDGRWRFTYAPEWSMFDLSPHIKIGAIYTDDLAHQRTVEWFFDNLLAEGAVRKSLAERKYISQEDIWGMLSYYGHDTSGAISVCTENVHPSAIQEYTPLSGESLASMIKKSKEGIPLMTQGDDPHMSLAGVQDKMALKMDDKGRFSLPLGSAPSTHILKPDNINKNYPFCPANEWFCMTLANKSGFNIPDVKLMNIGDHRVYIVQRYDRKFEEGFGTRRLHQIDLCQAMNVSPRAKYEDHAGLTVYDLFKTTSKCTSPAVANNAAMGWIVFNYLTGNSDAHAKNISFLMSSKGMRVAPFYDLLCVDGYHNNLRLCMGIGGELNAGWVEGCHWDALALTNNLDPRLLRNILERTSALIEKSNDLIAKSDCLLKNEQEWLADVILPVINQRISFAKEAIMEPVNNKAMLLGKKGVIPDDILNMLSSGVGHPR